MTRRILLTLDPDSDTPVATRYAIDIASRSEAIITALAIVDRDSIEAEVTEVGTAGETERMRDRLTADVNAKVRELLSAFEIAAEGTDVRFGELIREGVPFDRILDDLQFHDLLVIGREPRFFYANPETRTHLIEQIVRETPAPVLVVGENYGPVRSAVVALDGTASSIRAMRSFALLQPFGTDITIELLLVTKNVAISDAMLAPAQEFLAAHGFRSHPYFIQGGDIDAEILTLMDRSEANLVVAGGYTGSGENMFSFGSDTDRLISSCPVPVYLEH